MIAFIDDHREAYGVEIPAVRDFWSCSKQVKLRRKSVSVKEAERIKQTKGSPHGTIVIAHALSGR